MFWRSRRAWTALAVTAAGGLVYALLPQGCPETARRAAFVFTVAAFFWALEIIPLYATSILVVALETFLLLLPPGQALLSEKAGYAFFLSSLSNPVIILFMGGFVLAAAFRKYGIDRWVAWKLLRLFGRSPYLIILGFMITTGLIAMWMSKTATTALMLTMIFPLLAHLGPGDPFRKALVLAIPFAANIGGNGTPVGTPPNAIAVAFLAEHGVPVNFLSWMMMAVPLSALLLIMMSVVIYRLFPPANATLTFRLDKPGDIHGKGKAVIGIGLFTIFMWMSSGWHKVPEAISALLCTALLAALELIDRDDFKSIHWDILVLMWGGLALGEGMEVSGLAGWIVGLPIFSQRGFPLLVIFCFLSVFLSTFISNTATVNMLIPIALSIPGENPVMLAVIIAMSSSFDLALPISTPPMAMAYATREITVKDMLKAGIIFTAAANFLLLAGFKFVMKITFGIS